MHNVTDLTGLAGVALAVSAALLLLPGIATQSRRRLAVLQSAVFITMLIPFSELPLAAYVRGVTGDLSITTVALIGCALSRPWMRCGTDAGKRRRVLLMLVALAALLLYPLALGLTAVDPYRLGYGDPRFVIALLLVGLTAWVWNYYLIALCIAVAILAWTVGWYESDNLWDYVLDAWLALGALCAIMSHGVKTVLRRAGTQST